MINLGIAPGMRQPKGLGGVLEILSILEMLQGGKKDSLGKVLGKAGTRQDPFGRRMDPLAGQGEGIDWLSVMTMLLGL